ncbi:MAG: putative structural protein [Prokaryotic dsDNA virus sp.]|nr:MAG: putative structural protein [Prokaryotic dsDNA virus sp.]
MNQYLPDTYEKEFERYGNRTISSFLRLVGAELPSNSDLVKWAEQGRLHTKYTQCGTAAVVANDVVTFDINDALVPDRAATGLTAGTIAIRVGQTLVVTNNDGSGEFKGIVTAVGVAGGLNDNQITVAFYNAQGYTGGTGAGNADVTIFIYGSEFKKGSNGMQGSLEAEDEIFDNSPIIIKDKYAVSGSDMAQIGWIEVTTENGASGYLWYLKSEHETRLRFDDYLETAMIEAVPAEAGSGAIAAGGDVGNKGSEGIFHAVETRGNVWAGGNPVALQDFDNIISRLDKQGSIEENVLFLNRQFGFDIDDMLASQNSYGGGGTSYGLFDNDEEMALNLGFTGFRRGYDFYKSDWKYLNDPTMRGGLTGTGAVNGLLVPAGSTTVYDQILGKNAKRPFLHVRYRASETEDRKYKTWITGSAGGAMTSDLDAMEVNFLSERCVCTMGANNFVIFQS